MTSDSRNGGAGGPVTVGEAFSQAIALMKAGRYADAEEICEDIKKVRPQSPDVHHILGGIAFQTRRMEEAAKHFRRVIKLKPDHHEARSNLARICADLQLWEEAAHHFQILTENQGDNVNFLMGYARALLNLQRYEDAIKAYERLRSIHPSPDVVQTGIAEVLLKSGKVDEAEALYKKVLARSSDFAPALVNLALTYDVQGRMDEALTLLKDVIKTHPENIDAQNHYALALLTRKRFVEGWPAYEWRFRQPQTSTFHDKFDAPFWAGEPLNDRKILIWTEQGPGDEILLLTMLPDVLALSARCILVCSQRMAPLFARSFPDIDVVYREHVLSGDVKDIQADYQASFSHLGAALRSDTNAFPQTTGYLKADPDLTAELRTQYQGNSSAPLVGISWRSANIFAGHEKSTDLVDWDDILRTPNVRFVSLQYGQHDEDVKTAISNTGVDIVSDTSINPLENMDRFASQVAAMDLVISVSNTTVHVAGALNRPVWTLVPASVGRIWYWFLEQQRSPWYPSMRLFRQTRNAGWSGVLKDVASELKKWA